MINQLLAELDALHEEMIEAALAHSDMKESEDIIKYIMEKSKQNP